MPIRNNRNIHKTRPHIVRSLKKNVVKKRSSLKTIKTKQTSKSINTSYGSTEKIWNDEVVYIVGGGPSLKGFNWDRLSGKNVIAINRAYEVLPNADVLYWTDSRFYRWYRKDINNFKGMKVTCRPIVDKPSDVILLKANNSFNIDTRPEFLSHGNNSGYAAINLAVKLGAKKIYLLGYDMKSNPKNSHWHTGYQTHHNKDIYNKMIKSFDSIPSELKRLGVECFNANIKSELTVFRKCTIDDAISDLAYNPFRNT